MINLLTGAGFLNHPQYYSMFYYVLMILGPPGFLFNTQVSTWKLRHLTHSEAIVETST